MTLFSIIILLVFFVIDVSFRIVLGSVILKSQLCTLLLFYMIFRKPFRFCLVLLVLYCFVVRPFSGLGIGQVFLAYLIVLSVFFKIRTQIFTESYLVQSFWIFGMLVLHEILLAVFDYHSFHVIGAGNVLASFMFSSFFSAFFVIPLFYFLDVIFDRFGPGSREGYDSYLGQGIIRGRNRDQLL